jgi:phenylacetate-CoA ligase
VIAETTAPAGERPGVTEAARAILKRKIGIEVQVELVDKGATAALTQIEVRQKPIRLIDERFK